MRGMFGCEAGEVISEWRDECFRSWIGWGQWLSNNPPLSRTFPSFDGFAVPRTILRSWGRRAHFALPFLSAWALTVAAC